MDDRTVDLIFAGSLESLPPVSSKIVRIFTSSTFTGKILLNIKIHNYNFDRQFIFGDLFFVTVRVRQKILEYSVVLLRFKYHFIQKPNFIEYIEKYAKTVFSQQLKSEKVGLISYFSSLLLQLRILTSLYLKCYADYFSKKKIVFCLSLSFMFL